jgi:hypothetical protein
LAAFFRAAALLAVLTLLANAFVLPVILVYAALLTSLFVLLVFAGLLDALLASVKAAFFHSLIAISIVCHIFSPFLVMVELKVMGHRSGPHTGCQNQPLCQLEN